MSDMKRRDFLSSMVAPAPGLFTVSSVFGQNKTSSDLSVLAAGKRLKIFNRSVSTLNDGAKKGIRLSEAPGDGLAYLEGIEFANGAIELDFRGKDVQQQSFVGVAFHGVDGMTYDAVYFRPFNFKTEDPVR